jgi:hypothetical protein
VVKRVGLPAPFKLFSFGSLTAQTENSPRGSVSWWYHVAPVVRGLNSAGDEITLVLDPALEPRRPMPMQEWIKAILPDGNEKYWTGASICDEHSDGPYSYCYGDKYVTYCFPIAL